MAEKTVKRFPPARLSRLVADFATPFGDLLGGLRIFLLVPLQVAPKMVVLGCLLILPDARADLLHHWDLKESRWAGSEVKDLVSGRVGKTPEPPTFRDVAPVLNENCFVDVPGIDPADLPKASLSVEAWVKLSKGQRWGSLVGFMQDNGDYERGWSLGYNETAFVFWLSLGGPMVSVTADQPFKVNEWAHVAATFDGREIRLYVNGQLSGQAAAVGEIAYPEKARYTIGAYRDDNEFYPMFGQILNAKVYDQALSPEEIRTPAGLPKALEFTIRPAAKFLSPDSVRITWAAGENDVVEFGSIEELGTAVESSIDENGDRTALLTGLEPRTVYYYRILGGGDGEELQFSGIYELNTALNFTNVEVTAARGEQDAAQTVKLGLKLAGLRKGYAVIPNAFDPEFAMELARQSDFTVLGFDTDPDAVDRIRRKLYEQNIYGTRVSLLRVESLAELPVTSGLADVVFLDAWPPNLPIDEVVRILAPGRGVVCLKGAALKTVRELEQAGLEISSESGWTLARRPAAPDSGQWTHQYGDPGNTTTSGESLGGARSTGELAVQWFGRPGADFGLDRQSRMPAPLAANGRLFHQGMNRLIALNANNGAVLWGLEIPDLQRLNMPRDASNWCVDSENLYVAVRERGWVLDAETGDRKAALTVPADSGGSDWGYIARAGDRLIGSTVKPDSGYRSFWSGKMWFDGKAGDIGTAKVCSDSLFAYDIDTHQQAWNYRDGPIINTTIAVADGQVVFVESRSAELKSSETSQIAAAELWEDQFLVALDLASGKKLWERPIDTEDGTITFYLQVAPGAILITASNTQYHLYAFSPESGESLWNRSNPWPNADHSGHIQHPVILDGTIYLQPNGYALATGEIVTTKVGSRSGCHTYIGAKNALIYRGAGRRVAMWDRETETVSAWDRLRPSCWLSLIPANGMLLVPEGGGGCSCGGWMETSIGFTPVGFGKLETPGSR